MTSAFSWHNSVSLCPALFCTPRPNFLLLQVYLDFLLLHSSPLWWKGHHFFDVSSGRSCRLSCAAAAKLLQSCLTLCDPIDSSPPSSPVPGILQARTLEWVAISFSNVWKWKVKVKPLSRVWLCATPWTVAYQAPPSVGFSRQEDWSGVPSPSLALFVRLSLFIQQMFSRTHLVWNTEMTLVFALWIRHWNR